VLVGPKETRFSIHQEAICDKSKFFKAACSKRWIEGQEKLLRLPEAKPGVFRRYSNWIYSGLISGMRCTQTSSIEDKTSEHVSLINLYLLGDSLDDIQLRNTAIQELSKHLDASNFLSGPSVAAKVWSSTPPGSRLRKLIVHNILCSREQFVAEAANYPEEFMREIALAALCKVPTVSFDEANRNFEQFLELEDPKDNNN